MRGSRHNLLSLLNHLRTVTAQAVFSVGLLRRPLSTTQQLDIVKEAVDIQGITNSCVWLTRVSCIGRRIVCKSDVGGCLTCGILHILYACSTATAWKYTTTYSNREYYSCTVRIRCPRLSLGISTSFFSNRCRRTHIT